MQLGSIPPALSPLVLEVPSFCLTPWPLPSLGHLSTFGMMTPSEAAVVARHGPPMLAPPSDPPTTIGHMDSSEAVADSLHASMVLDFERNAAFARGLRLSLEQLHLQPDRRPAGGLKVLDIGTGSGLLALLAARVAPPGVVSEVVACEAVPLVAAAAQRVVRDNPPGEASCTSGSRHPAPVRVLAKRSTSLLPSTMWPSVGPFECAKWADKKPGHGPSNSPL